jgi:hypothetical protein
MIHDSERESAFNHDAIIRLCKKMANEDVRKRPLRQTHRYYPSTKHSMHPTSPVLTSEEREASAHQPSPQELAERAAIILALNVTSSKRHNRT